MGNQTIGTIHLSGTEAVEFANSLFKPTQEIIENNRKKWNEIDENISLKRKNDGFEADIAYLDLSFLDNIPEEQELNIEVTLHIKPQSVFYQNSRKDNMQTTIIEKKDDKFNDFKNSGFLAWAA